MLNSTILVVDDDPNIRFTLRSCLEGDGYFVLEAEDEQGTISMISENEIDLITLDLQLSKERGLDVAKRIRSVSNIPIIIVTGQGDVIDRIVGLEVGADDYISKPFHLREMLARVRSVLRRSVGETKPVAQVRGDSVRSEVITFDGMSAHLSRYELRDRSGDLVEISASDFRMLTIFLKNPNIILSRDRLMDLLKGADWSPFDRAIDNQVARIRKKIEKNPRSPVLIKTVRGLGYTFTAYVGSETPSQGKCA